MGSGRFSRHSCQDCFRPLPFEHAFCSSNGFLSHFTNLQQFEWRKCAPFEFKFRAFCQIRNLQGLQAARNGSPEKLSLKKAVHVYGMVPSQTLVLAHSSLQDFGASKSVTVFTGLVYSFLDGFTTKAIETDRCAPQNEEFNVLLSSEPEPLS
jgi:hypothetical protein